MTKCIICNQYDEVITGFKYCGRCGVKELKLMTKEDRRQHFKDCDWEESS